MRLRRAERPNAEGFWPGVADSLLGALMMVLLLVLGALAMVAAKPEPKNISAMSIEQLRERYEELLLKAEKNDKQIRDLLQQLEQEAANSKRLAEEKSMLAATNAELLAENKRLKDLAPQEDPPIIELKDVDKLSFTLGSAAISTEFRIELRDKYFPLFERILRDHPVVDTIEIIGHTDKSKVSSESSSLDEDLSKVISGAKKVEEVTSGSNADLGLMRAFALKQEWEAWNRSHPHLTPVRSVVLRCYSAAHGVFPLALKDEVGGLDPSINARRIEIRFTKLKH